MRCNEKCFFGNLIPLDTIPVSIFGKADPACVNRFDARYFDEWAKTYSCCTAQICA
jgi:hypothetical protein